MTSLADKIKAIEHCITVVRGTEPNTFTLDDNKTNFYKLRDIAVILSEALLAGREDMVELLEPDDIFITSLNEALAKCEALLEEGGEL